MSLIDLHSHILPGVDDGPATMAEAVDMAERAAENHVSTIVATPHAFKYPMDVLPDVRDRVLQQLREKLAERGIKMPLLPGYECHLVPELADVLERDARYSLTDEASGWLLIELPDTLIPTGFEELVFRLRMKGFRPILCHPERIDELQGALSRLEYMKQQGLYIQITTASLCGAFGWRAKRAAIRFLKHGMVDVISTDAHRAEDYAGVSKALAVVQKTVDPVYMEEIVEKKPSEILDMKT